MAASFCATVTFATLFRAVQILVEHYLPDSGRAFVLLVAVAGVLGVYLARRDLMGRRKVGATVSRECSSVSEVGITLGTKHHRSDREDRG